MRDTQTGDIWHFVCDQWLTPKNDNVVRQLEVNHTPPLRYAFRVKAEQSLRDQHIYLSIFASPPLSNFTRVQRLSYAFAFITSSMLVNIMFYGTQNAFQARLLVPVLNITMSDVLIGTETALICMPINMLIVAIFRMVTPRSLSFDICSGDEDAWQIRGLDDSTLGEDKSNEFVNEIHDTTFSLAKLSVAISEVPYN